MSNIPLFDVARIANGDPAALPPPSLAERLLGQSTNASTNQTVPSVARYVTSSSPPIVRVDKGAVPPLFPGLGFNQKDGLPDLHPLASRVSQYYFATRGLSMIAPWAVNAADVVLKREFPSISVAEKYFGEAFPSRGFARVVTLAGAPHLYGFLRPSYDQAIINLKTLGAFTKDNALSRLMSSAGHQEATAAACASGGLPISRSLFQAPAYDATWSFIARLDSASLMLRTLIDSGMSLLPKTFSKDVSTVKKGSEFLIGKESRLYKFASVIEGLLEVVDVLTLATKLLDMPDTDEDRIALRYSVLSEWALAAKTNDFRRYLAALSIAVACKYGQPAAAVAVSLASATDPNVLRIAHHTLEEFCYGLKTIYHFYS